LVNFVLSNLGLVNFIDLSSSFIFTYRLQLGETMARLAASTVLVLVASLSLLAAGQPPPERTCKLDLTSIAALSCRESPQAPTASCCNALLYAIDTMPLSSLDQGLCCLCIYIYIYMASNPLDYDLASVYRSCGGKDGSQVTAWLASSSTPFDCKRKY
jgi:hypothetical protein